MKMSLDYDQTYTLDPAFWSGFIRSAAAAGHEVVCVTMRREDEAVDLPCPVFYTARRAKRDFAADISLKIDVWIDDSPHWIFTDG